MAEEYTQQQIRQLLEKLPIELKEAFSSAETEEAIWGVCEKNNINEVAKVTKLVGNVLLGLLPPDDFQNLIEIELKLEKETARKVAHEINRFIFYPVKPALEQLYGMERTGGEGMPAETTKQKPNKIAGEDRYREAIE